MKNRTLSPNPPVKCGEQQTGLRLPPGRAIRVRTRPASWPVLVFLLAGPTGCLRLPPLSPTAPSELPDLIGVVKSEGEALQVGNPAMEGDSILTGEIWPDERLGWRVGDPFRMTLSEIDVIVSLVGVRTQVWEVLSSEYADRPVRWQEVYIFEMEETIPLDCHRVAILLHDLPRDTGDGRFSPTLEQIRVSAGSLGANALHLSEWEDSETDQRVRSALFGPDWDYPSALALRCPGLSRAPGRSPSSSGDGT